MGGEGGLRGRAQAEQGEELAPGRLREHSKSSNGDGQGAIIRQHHSPVIRQNKTTIGFSMLTREVACVVETQGKIPSIHSLIITITNSLSLTRSRTCINRCVVHVGPGFAATQSTKRISSRDRRGARSARTCRQGCRAASLFPDRATSA